MSDHSDHKNCKCGFSRRNFLATGLTGFLGYAAASQTELFGAPRLNWLLPQDGPGKTTVGKAKAVIMLWMSGGPTQFETWSPKAGTKNGGPTKAIDTSVDGIQVSENFPNIAKQMENIAIVRSMTSRESDHQRGRYLLNTGYSPQPVLAHPGFGSIIAYEKGKKDFDLPSYIAVGSPGMGAGILPPDYEPLRVPRAGAPLENLNYARGVDKNRFRKRMELLKRQEADFEKGHESDPTERKKKAYEKADRLMHSPLLKSFDLKGEPADLVKEYGDSNFGRGCLLARRLVETGVKFVQVSLGGWDTHQENFTRVPTLCKQLDPGMATLIKDLKQKNMLDSTLVAWMGEFGRTPRINNDQGRDHYSRAWSMALAGGGIQGGRVIGDTDKDGVEVKDDPVTVPDLFATFYKTLGIDYTKKLPTKTGVRYVYVEEGVPVKNLIS